MFNLFKKKCPICRMELKEEKNYLEGWGTKFCSEQCREEYRKQMIKERSKQSRSGCCK